MRTVNQFQLANSAFILKFIEVMSGAADRQTMTFMCYCLELKCVISMIIQLRSHGKLNFIIENKSSAHDWHRLLCPCTFIQCSIGNIIKDEGNNSFTRIPMYIYQLLCEGILNDSLVSLKGGGFSALTKSQQQMAVSHFFHLLPLNYTSHAIHVSMLHSEGGSKYLHDVFHSTQYKKELKQKQIQKVDHSDPSSLLSLSTTITA